MSILVIASTKNEIAPFLEKYPEADFLITGVGIPASMFQIMDCIHQNKYQFLIQVGVAGSYSKAFKLGEAFCVEKDCFGDLGVIENDKLNSLFDIGLAEQNESPFKEGWLINENSFLDLHNKAIAITVNLLTENNKHIEMLKNKYQPDIETMEGAVIHYIGLKMNIPFLQIRGISNEVGERDKSKWRMKEAIESSNKLLIAFYENYISQNKKQ